MDCSSCPLSDGGPGEGARGEAGDRQNTGNPEYLDNKPEAAIHVARHAMWCVHEAQLRAPRWEAPVVRQARA